ncbi:GntR family transcriptional regulator [Catenulispora subtropica]|uniref:HTH gntR-type domain-containing protein n=1 Tax=Catenulispora subtropica TaxID=450798 RepID=A0ABP5BYN8_9ACTN
MSEAVTRRGHRWVADVLRDRIENNVYPAGTQLPTEASLVEEFAIARDTVRRALAVLAEDGLVVTTHGRGTFVRDERDAGIGQPKHAQVGAKLRALIEAGEVEADAAFLTEAEVQRRFSVSRRTARAALKGMEDDGLLYVTGRRRLVARQDSDTSRPNSR